MELKAKIIIPLVAAIVATAQSLPGAGGPEATAGDLITDFASAYEGKSGPAVETVFGLEVKGEGGGFWTVGIGPGRKVAVKEGKPAAPTYYVTCDLETLEKIRQGTWNALTAAGRARSSDPAPLDIAFMDGFAPAADTMEKVFHVLFHFFNTSNPEIVRFGEANSRFVHGGNAVVFYYMKGLRTAWYQLKKGMIINADPKDQTNPFPTLFICTRGEGKARLGGREFVCREGDTVFIPAGMTHTFWNEQDAPCEGVIIMFGEGA